MAPPIAQPRIDEEILAEMLQGMIDARIETLPAPLGAKARKLCASTSSAMMEERRNDLVGLGIDWSRAGPVEQGISAEYCPCIYCGQSVANKRGIVQHLAGAQCTVLKAIVFMARVRFCKTSAWRNEIAAMKKA